MQLELFDFEENRTQTYEAHDIPKNFRENFASKSINDSQFQRAIDNLPLSADQKSMIFSISEFTLRIGEQVLTVGRKILEFSLLFFKKFPATSFGLIVGLVVSSLIPAGNIRGFAIPFVASLAGLIKKLVILFSIGFGLKEDLKNTAVGNMISAATLNIRKGMEV